MTHTQTQTPTQTDAADRASAEKLARNRARLRRVLLVSRHPAAIDWLWDRLDLATLARHEVVQVEHLDAAHMSNLIHGDSVIGTLPIHMVARLCEKGVEYWHLELDVTERMRGRELTASDMEAGGARLMRYHVEDISDVGSHYHGDIHEVLSR